MSAVTKYHLDFIVYKQQEFISQDFRKQKFVVRVAEWIGSDEEPLMVRDCLRSDGVITS